MELRLNREQILTAPIVKTMFLLAWPLMISSILQTAYNMVDVIWLGRLPREEALTAVAAVNFSWPLVFLFISIGMGLGSAAVPIISQHIGAGNRDRASYYTGQIIGTISLISLAAAILGFLFSGNLLSLIGARGELLSTSTEYTRIVFLGFIFMFISQGSGFILSAEGDTVTPLKITAISVTVNILLDPIFIFGYGPVPAMGVFGAAVATILARIVSSAFFIYLLMSGHLRLTPKLRDFLPGREAVKLILKIGIPSAVGMSAAALGFVVIQGVLAQLPRPELAIAAYGLGERVIDIMFILVGGLTSSTAVMLGQSLGAGDKERGSRIGFTSLNIMFYTMISLSTILYLVRTPILRFFMPHNPDVLSAASDFMSIVLIGISYFGIFRVVMSLLRGSGHTTEGMILSSSRLWLLRIPMVVVFALYLGMGAIGVWTAMALSNMISAGIAILFYLKGDWKVKVVKTERLISETALKT